jgi:endonuclease/exonuclease/phosphatase family metal-dependent hydrolase
MGLLSWLRNGPRRKTLVRTRYDDPELAEVERAAAADIAAVEEDDKYFDPHSPGQEPGE